MFNPISYGGLDQRLCMGGGAFGTPRLFLAFLGHISGHMEALLTNKQLKGLISDNLEKKIRDYLIGQDRIIAQHIFGLLNFQFMFMF